jgi:prepilin-type N-terminal cleavage/methylation domain-containing protein
VVTANPEKPGRSDAGFSLLELIFVLAITSLLCGIMFGSFQSLSATIQGDADMRVVEWQLKLARETAINQRRSIEVQFTAPNFIKLVRNNLPNGTTVISTIYLEHNARFVQFTGQGDTPDLFGNASSIDFGAATTKVMFTADGMLVDQSGNPINGTIFIGQLGRPATSRALTVFGPTARIRAYRWNGTHWRP